VTAARAAGGCGSVPLVVAGDLQHGTFCEILLRIEGDVDEIDEA
jgi:hypothetical protein